ncbi:MAG: cytochrome c biogenesis protein CcsA [Holophaga sp.]|nr:cytochrome c biogenesis protein CcsA [Holophaga sp.]
MKLTKYLPWVAGLLALVATLVLALPSAPVRGFDLNAFGGLPVLEGGRVKPLNSIARNSLLVIRSQQSFRFEGRTIQPDEWLADLLFRPQVADRQPVFVINDPDVLGLIGLQQTADRYFSFETIIPHIDAIERQAQAAHAIEAPKRDRFQNAIENLYSRLLLYHRLRNSIQLADSPGLALELAQMGNPEIAARQESMIQLAFFRPLPPLAGQGQDAWKNTGEAMRARSMGMLHPGLGLVAQIGGAYAIGDAQRFNQAVTDLRGQHLALQPGAQHQADSELRFNRAQPFYAGMVIYVLALLTLFTSWAWKRELLQPTAFALLLAGSVVHTIGLASRIILQGRPPVTNLYSSAVFVGWGAVILGIVLERIYRKGFGTAVAAAAGFGSLIVAHHLAADGDTMEMMRAVLDSNFWLATHVVAITIGYSGTFLAGAIAIGYTLRKQIVGESDPETTKALSGMAFGVICFALLFSFVGTVLGGIWADQSWGRFWGWDPKENGALLIVLWNAIILHARLAGYVRDRGIMAMAIFGNIITSLSWFGVNMLGVGLHSYGFMDKAFWALSGFIASQLILMALCLAPPMFWKRVLPAK